MDIGIFWQTHVTLFAVLIGFFSLFIGSFLNVIIYRLPLMLKQEWQKECQLLLELPSAETETFNLCLPRSHCPHCKTPISAWHNIPLVAFIWLRACCQHCKHPISYRYPFIELLTGLLSFWVTIQFGFSYVTGFALLFTWILIASTFIDFDHHLLPDNLTLPLLWLGLFANLFECFTPLSHAVIGALSGYLSLWSIMWLYRLFTGKQGMGHGDFKLFAALGAWFGFALLPMMILIAALLGLIGGVAWLIFKGQSHQTPIAFGPCLAIAGFMTLVAQSYFPVLLY